MSFLENLFKKNEDEHYHKSAGDIQEEILQEEKEDMIQGIEDLSETSVKEVMVPRIDVDFVSVSLTKEELLEKFCEHEFSRFPVYSESIDNVVGILHIKDLISALTKGEEINIEKVMRKPFFVPESKRIDTLLREFKRRHVHIAIAIDEYGGVSGIVCLEDIIEEIVGNIQDEFDDERDDVSKVSDNVWIWNVICNRKFCCR
ncbi:MAG: CBS domain-containing protein [Spirochaetaceae bacterium]|nr:CBS domain-containing protein [Spirochaetaceae bacterium]